MTPVRWTIFPFGTILFVIATWFIALRAKRYHGIYRFIAFESILVLVILNYPCWFHNPSEPLRIMFWCLLLGSTMVASIGFYQYYREGKPRVRMEETTRLITSGLYRNIRQPLCLSMMPGGFGIMLKEPGEIQIGMLMVNTRALYLAARPEEEKMKIRFGAVYRNNMDLTKMFITRNLVIIQENHLYI